MIMRGTADANAMASCHVLACRVESVISEVTDVSHPSPDPGSDRLTGDSCHVINDPRRVRAPQGCWAYDLDGPGFGKARREV